MIKVLIADDHQLIREGFKKLIEREIGLTVVGEAKNSGEVLSFLRQHPCDVLVLDISMPGKSGLELLKDLKILAPEVSVLMLTMHPEDRFAIRALKAGAAGYITKESAPEQLITAIHKVFSGGKYVSSSLAEQLAFGVDNDRSKPLHEYLSDREFQILLLIGKGKTVTQIAEELGLGLSTINTYRKRILEKMKLNSNAELIHYAVKNNLVD